MRRRSIFVWALLTTALMTGCAANVSSEDLPGSESQRSATPTAARGAASASVDLGDLDDFDDDDFDDDFDDDDDDFDDDDDDLDLGHLDVDPDDLDDLDPAERKERLAGIADSIRNPGPDAALACIAVGPSTVAVLESRLRGLTVNDASAHLSDDGEHFFVVAGLSDSATAVFASAENPAVDGYDGTLFSVDSEAAQSSDWPQADDADFAVNADDSGAEKVLDCVG